MKIEQEIMEMFDKSFLTKSKCCGSDVRKLLSKNNSDLYCKGCGRYCNEIEKTKAEELKSFISHIITLVQKREREEMVEMIEGHKIVELSNESDVDYTIRQSTNMVIDEILKTLKK